MGRILIVEDELPIGKGLESIINSIDKLQKVYTTRYAASALEYAKNNKVDLFLLDIQLLDYSGMELAEEIRNIEHYKLSPIIFITSIPTEEIIAFKKLHCYDYIIKPFKKETVLNTISTIINCGIKNSNEDKRIILKQKGFTVSIFQKDIVYIESSFRKLSIVTVNETTTVSTYTLVSIHKELSSSFIRCHKGFIVNVNFIKKIDKNNRLIYLRNNLDPIPYGLKYKDALVGDWL